MANRNIKGDVKVEFAEASSRQSLDSGESVKTLFGKLRKWLSDLKPVAFSGSYNDLSNKPTIPNVINSLTSDSTTDALAAAQGKELKRIIDASAIEVISDKTPLPYTSLLENALTNYQVYGTVAGIGMATESGEPTGYKITLTNSDGTTTDNYNLYIGDSKLINEEYIDYKEQKIYKRNPAAFIWITKFTKYDDSQRVEYIVDWNDDDRSLITGAGFLTIRSVAQTITHDTPGVTVVSIQSSIDNPNTQTVPVRFRDLGEGCNVRCFVTINGEYVYGPSFHFTYDEVIAAPNQTIYVERPPVNTPIEPPLPFPAITAYDDDNTLNSVEALERIDIEGLIRIYGGYLPTPCLYIEAYQAETAITIQNTSDFTLNLFSKFSSGDQIPKFAFLKLSGSGTTYYLRAMINVKLASSGTTIDVSFIADGTTLYKFGWYMQSGTVSTPTITAKTLA